MTPKLQFDRHAQILDYTECPEGATDNLSSGGKTACLQSRLAQ